ncbi:MAG: 5' nucleotidase, NT5C type [Solirubrobacteraceae bacterium]
MRIAIDIDSTLHHYWDVLSEVSVRRFGIELPYDEQFTWGITRLRPDQLELCIEESHTDERILAGTPYPGAVQAVRRWHEQGHFVHVTSHRALDRRDATAAWLGRIGLPFDDLHCSYDKVARCVELEIDVLIDDGPENLAAALELGIVVATLGHPWNRDLCEEEDVICARDWGQLAQLLEPVLSRQGMEAGAAK